MGAAVDELRASLRLLRSPRFGTFWFASFLSNVGTWAQQVAEPWLLLNLGASPFIVGLDAFASSAPVWALTVLGGALADHADRRRVIAACQSLQMLCPALLTGMLVLRMPVHPALVVVLSLVVGITDALSMPSFQSIVPTLVARDEIPRGLALNATQFNLSRIAGPALAGALLASVGAAACFGVSAASYVPFVGVALWILPRRVVRGDRSGARNPFAGLGTILAAPRLRGALLTVFASSLLCAPLVTFCPVLVRSAFGGSASHYSLAVGAFGVGGLVGATLLLAVPPTQDRRRWSAAAAIAHALLVIASSQARWYWVLPLTTALAGAAMTVSSTSANGILQGTSDPRLLGRAAGMFMLAMRGGMSLGSLLTGATVGALGVRRALLVDGVLALVVQAAVARAWLRNPPKEAP